MTKARAGIYCRISSDQGTERGLGVARQEEDCRAYVERIDAKLVSVWIDNDVSAFSGRKRPGYIAACEALDAGTIDTLVVWHPDRLHRSPAELEDFVALVERVGAQVRTVTAGDFDLATPEGRLVARITGAVARKESEDKSRRLRRKQVELRENGKPAGRLGYPYKAGAEVDTERAEIVRELARRIIDGESLTSLAKELNERNVPTSLGGKWTHTTLRVTMSAPSLAGLVTHKGRIVGNGVWEPVLDRITWERVRAAIGARPRGGTATYLLSNIARCALCGNGMTGASRKTDTGKLYLYGCISSGGGCGKVWINRDRLDALVVPRIRLALADPSLKLDAMATPAEDLQTQIGEAEERLVTYAKMLDAGELEVVEWKVMRTQALDRLNALRAQEAFAAPLREASVPWNDMPLRRQREIIAALLDVTVSPARHRGARDDDERVEIVWKV